MPSAIFHSPSVQSSPEINEKCDGATRPYKLIITIMKCTFIGFQLGLIERLAS
jgi:hypothetical protein